MIIDDVIYDVIIVGSGAGGGTIARKLAPTGKKILVLERGTFPAKESSELRDLEVFNEGIYHAKERWYDKFGDSFHPQTNYSVGGNTKIYSGVLQRLRERDFEEVRHQEGLSPAWPLKYADLASYYTEAENLYNVHGKTGDDPTEPPREGDYPSPAIDHEATVAEIADIFSKRGLKPAYLPIGIGSQGRTDSEDTGITPALDLGNVTLKIGAKVTALRTNPSGSAVKGVEADINGHSYLFMGDVIVLACGAINSAALLLCSANERHPHGLGNSSDLVGRYLMKHLMTVIVQVSGTDIPGSFQRTLYLNDFYWGDESFPYPMGHIENSGGILQDVIFSESPPLLSIASRLMPKFGLRQLATHSLAWWLQTEDLPVADNCVRVSGDKITVDYTPNNIEAHDRLLYRFQELIKAVEPKSSLSWRSVHPYGTAPLAVVAHQSGTCRFGEDPKTSVLDLNCRAHELDNLYVVDSSFFPSISATSPALTVIANALRVGEHLIERLK